MLNKIIILICIFFWKISYDDKFKEIFKDIIRIVLANSTRTLEGLEELLELNYWFYLFFWSSEQSNKVKLLTLNELFQAIRSYLHFSQISSWINQSGGQQPKNIAYRYVLCSFIQNLTTNENEELTGGA